MALMPFVDDAVSVMFSVSCTLRWFFATLYCRCICSVCNEKLALQDAVEKLSQQMKQLYAEKMSEFSSLHIHCIILLYGNDAVNMKRGKFTHFLSVELFHLL